MWLTRYYWPSSCEFNHTDRGVRAIDAIWTKWNRRLELYRANGAVYTVIDDVKTAIDALRHLENNY